MAIRKKKKPAALTAAQRLRKTEQQIRQVQNFLIKQDKWLRSHLQGGGDPPPPNPPADWEK